MDETLLQEIREIDGKYGRGEIDHNGALFLEMAALRKHYGEDVWAEGMQILAGRGLMPAVIP